MRRFSSSNRSARDTFPGRGWGLLMPLGPGMRELGGGLEREGLEPLLMLRYPLAAGRDMLAAGRALYSDQK